MQTKNYEEINMIKVIEAGVDTYENMQKKNFQR